MKISTAKPATSRWKRANLLTSLMLVFPLFLVYQVGVLAIPQVYNGADLITSQLLHLLHGQLAYYLLANGVLLLAFVILVLVMRRRNEFHARMFVPVLLESAVYAVTMGSLIVFVMQNVLHVDPRLAVGPEAVGPFGKIILSFGAGVHEELVFRLMMIPGFAALGEKVFKLRRWVAIALAFLASAILFSAAHHVIGGEPWKLGVFTYRVLCGLIFAVIFQTRGFAVAVYTHALYDVFVLLVQS